MEPKTSYTSNWEPKNLFRRAKTQKFDTMGCTDMTLMIYIKPFDDEVFENFLKLIKYIQDKEQARGCPITVMVAPDLFQTFEA